MTENYNPILAEILLLIYHPVWRENVNVSAEVFGAQLAHCPGAGQPEYDEEKQFYSSKLFMDDVHTEDTLVGRVACFPADNGMIRQISAYSPIRLPFRSIFPFEEALSLLEKRFGKPVAFARQDMVFEEVASMNRYVYSTPLGEVTISIWMLTDSSPAMARFEISLSPNQEVQEPIWPE